MEAIGQRARPDGEVVELTPGYRRSEAAPVTLALPVQPPCAIPLESASVFVSHGEAAFAALEPDWPRARSTHMHAFGAFGWFDAARRWLPEDATVGALGVRRGGKLVAALPFFDRTVRRAGLRVRERRVLSVPDTQASDLVACEAATRDDIDALARALAGDARGWDVLRVELLAPDSLVETQFVDALRRAGLAVDVQHATANCYIALDGDWATFYATRSRRLKKANNLAANRLSRAGRVDVDWLMPGTGSSADAERYLAAAIDVSARSWKQDTANALDRAGPRAFIERLTRAAHASGMLSIWLLSLDGRPVASEYQLICDGNVYALRSDFDRELEAVSPGTHLNRVLLERLFARGLGRYYMGPGANAYKLRWTDTSEPVRRMSVWSRSPRGRVLAQWERRVKPLAVRIRDRLRGPRTTSTQESAEGLDT